MPSRPRSSTGAIRELTGGNAFLVTELWRELVDADDVDIGPGGARLNRPAAELGTPTTVREVVNQRLPRLSAEANEVLELAAVAGADFELDTVRRAEVVPGDVLLDAVDEAVRNGLLVEEPGRRLAYRFAHELVRRAVDRPALRGAGGRDPPPRRRGARGAAARTATAAGRSPRSRTTTLRRPPVGGVERGDRLQPARGRVGGAARSPSTRPRRGSRSRSSSAFASRPSAST